MYVMNSCIKAMPQQDEDGDNRWLRLEIRITTTATTTTTTAIGLKNIIQDVFLYINSNLD